MPEIRFQHVVSASSEDKLHKAENLLKPSGGGKWKCSKPGEAMAAVIFQLEKETAIDSIHVGNESSAFVEVLVGKAAASSDKDFQVLLVNSMLMNPIESRNNTNTNGVRIFKSDSLVKPVLSQKWDRVKVVCTQPFNKTITYGLSFIKLLSPEVEEEAAPERPKKFGAFTLKKDEATDDGSAVSRFLAMGKLPESKESVRASSSAAAAATTATSSAALSRGSDALVATSKSHEKNSRSTPAAKSPTPAPAVGSSKAVRSTSPPSKKRSGGDDSDRASASKRPKSSDRAAEKPAVGDVSASASSEKNARSSDAAASFERQFSGVVFVLSGFQNPLRSDLRDMAIQMGARYRSDWDSTCTHLVCAFPNTPKFNEVLSRGGNIVNKNWIVDCHKQRRLLPWKNYSMLPASVAEAKCKGEPAHSVGVDTASSNKPAPKDKAEIKADDATLEDKSHDEGREDIDYGGSTDVDSEHEGSVTTADRAYEIDTEDEIECARKHTKETRDKSESSGKCSSVDVPTLPEYFAGMQFFLYGDYPQRETVERYVVAYGGEVEPYMTGKVTHVITTSKWDRNFDDAKRVNPKVIFVTPQWIMKVHDVQKLVSYSRYEIQNTDLDC